MEMDKSILEFVSEYGALRGKTRVDVAVYEDRVEINRDTKFNVAKNTVIYFADITGITHKKGNLGIGEQWITFIVPGINPGVVRTADVSTTYISLGNVQVPFTDDYSIVFRKDNSFVDAYYEKIMEIYGKFRQQKNKSAVDVVTIEKESALDKLKKLKEIYDMGIISETEYEEKKAKLLLEI